MADRPAAPCPVDVVGLHGGASFGPDAAAAVAAAELLVASPRHLDDLGPARPPGVPTVDPGLGLVRSVDEGIAAADAGRRVVVLASGDPGFFGIVRVLAARVPPERLRVHPAPSSVALAFARLSLPWDDAVVVSAHGRPLADAVARITGGPTAPGKVAVLTSPDNPPERVAQALLDGGHLDPATPAAVLTRLGEPAAERVVRADLATLASGTHDPMSVLVVLAGEPVAGAPMVAWGRPTAAFSHRDGMITKSEVRAVALGKLTLPAGEAVLWDVGAGSGSVGIEAACVARRLQVFAVEREPADAERIPANAENHGVGDRVTVVVGEAPAALDDLPDPDRVFLGGGGIDALDVALARLRPGGVVVATYAVVDRAVTAWHRLGNLAEVAVSRGVATGDLGVRLRAENPVFVVWGPTPDP